MNFAESLKQLLWKSHQLIALQLQLSKICETVEEATGQRCEPVAIQLEIQQAPLEKVITKNIFIQICQLILLQVQLFQVVQPVEGSVAKAPELVAFQSQAAKIA